MEEDLIEIWVRYYHTYFQIGTSCDGDRNGFFDKVYYINTSTDLSLFKLLNNIVFDDGFYSSPEIQPLLNVKLVDGKPLMDIWHNCVIVAVDEMSPDNYIRIWE